MVRDSRAAGAVAFALLVVVSGIGYLPSAAHPSVTAPPLRPTPAVSAGRPLPQAPVVPEPTPAVPVAPAAGPPIVVNSFTQSVTVGVAPLSVRFVLNVTTSDVATPPVHYTLNWTFSNDSPVVTMNLNSSGTSAQIVAEYTWVYSTIGTFNATVGVRNNLSSTPVITHKDFVYVETPIVLNWTSPPTVFDLGPWFNSTANYTGGQAPYTAVWLSTPVNCLTSNQANGSALNCDPLITGTYSVHLQVTDTHGLRVNSYDNFTVKSDLEVRLSYTSWFFCVGTSGMFQANLTAYVVGGTGDSPYAYLWNFGDGTPDGNASTVPHRFATGPAPYVVTATVTDSGGGRYVGNITVSAAYPACTGSSSVSYAPPLILLQGGIFLLAIVLVVLLLLFLRRRSRPPTAPVASWKPGEGDPASTPAEPTAPGPGEPVAPPPGAT